MEKEKKSYRNPVPTVDVIVELEGPNHPGGAIVLIERKNPPFGWAIPGGFVDYGESLEEAARREIREETNLSVELIHQLHTYSDPERDARLHTITTVYVGRSNGTPHAADDAKAVGVFTKETIPTPLAFDHQAILADYFNWRQNKSEFEQEK